MQPVLGVYEKVVMQESEREKRKGVKGKQGCPRGWSEMEIFLFLFKENEVEHEDLTQSLNLVKDVIAAVNSKVSNYEKKTRLDEIYNRTDNKSIMRMKSGQMFAREDLRHRKLIRDGPVSLKNAAGRLKGNASLSGHRIAPHIGISSAYSSALRAFDSNFKSDMIYFDVLETGSLCLFSKPPRLLMTS